MHKFVPETKNSKYELRKRKHNFKARPDQGSARAWSNGFRCFPKLPWMSINRFSGFEKTFGYLLVDRKPMGFWKFQGHQARAVAIRYVRYFDL